MKKPDLHYKQIPTSYSAIKNAWSESDRFAITSLLRCFTYDLDSDRYITQLLVTASCFEQISRLVYRGSDGQYKQLKEEAYRKSFKNYAETTQEVFEIVREYGAAETDADLIFKKLWQIADLVCPMMACISEQAFVSEYAYAIDYVIRHEAELPKPQILQLFPRNYPDYRYWEGPVVDRIRAYMER